MPTRVKPQRLTAFVGVGGSIGDANTEVQSAHMNVKKRVRILKVNIGYKTDNTIGSSSQSRTNQGILYDPSSLFHLFLFSSRHHHLDAAPRNPDHPEYRGDADRIFYKCTDSIGDIPTSKVWDQCFIWIFDDNLGEYGK